MILWMISQEVHGKSRLGGPDFFAASVLKVRFWTNVIRPLCPMQIPEVLVTDATCLEKCVANSAPESTLISWPGIFSNKHMKA